MKRLWTLLVLALAVSAASIPETGWAQSSADVEKVTVDSLGLKGMTVNGIAVNDSGHYFAATDDYVQRSKDAGKTWVQLKNGLEGILFEWVKAISVVDSGYLLAGTEDHIFKSTDNGDSWHRVGTSGNSKDVRPRSQFLRKGNSLFICGWGSGIWRSDDNGWTWQWVSLVDTSTTFPAVRTITMTPSGTFFVGTGHADGGNGVFRSTNDGKTWVQVNNGLDNGKAGGYSSLNIWRLAAPHSGTSKTVIASTAYAGVYRTDDEGDSWYKVENLPIFAGGAATICTPGIFVNGWNSSDKDATYRSVNNGISWTKIPELNGYEVWSFYQLSATKLLVGAVGGIFLANFDIIATPVEESPTIPTAFQLSQNYPNPFNPNTTIEFTLPERSFVKLIIYNALGQEIETLVAGEKGAGNHRFVWNASRYPSGVYVYQLETEKFSQTKKMILLK